MTHKRLYSNHVLSICILSALVACSLSSGETITQTETTVCSARVYPDGEEMTEVHVHYEVPESYNDIMAEGTSCKVVSGGTTYSSLPDASRFSWCEVNGLPADTKVTIGIDRNQNTASVVQSFNWESLSTQSIECVLHDGRYVCDGRAMLSTKPFYRIGLHIGNSTTWREGGDFPTDKETKNFFSCVEQVDPANISQKWRFKAVQVSDRQTGDEWKCRFESGTLAYEISSVDLMTAVLSGDSKGERQLTCSTSESESSYH